LKAIEKPIYQILANAESQKAALIVESILEGQTETYSLTGPVNPDAKTMLDNGIADPAKVIIAALKNAADIAGRMLQSAVIITDKDETA